MLTLSQTLSFVVIALMIGAFVWGRFRYDLIAALALLLALAVGVVPLDEASPDSAMTSSLLLREFGLLPLAERRAAQVQQMSQLWLT
ncbi:hypothetical protein ACFX5Q_05450 [Mesorhizobium sp. IMUNJ 23033]|uniref:hypothetical protein n=1 Tax=Mesorhizobium sp. IMUNJ 23033 TaxID=3378039 RepID=UPI00384DA18E